MGKLLMPGRPGGASEDGGRRHVARSEQAACETYSVILRRQITERLRWRHEYAEAKRVARSATDAQPDRGRRNLPCNRPESRAPSTST